MPRPGPNARGLGAPFEEHPGKRRRGTGGMLQTLCSVYEYAVCASRDGRAVRTGPGCRWVGTALETSTNDPGPDRTAESRRCDMAVCDLRMREIRCASTHTRDAGAAAKIVKFLKTVAQWSVWTVRHIYGVRRDALARVCERAFTCKNSTCKNLRQARCDVYTCPHEAVIFRTCSNSNRFCTCSNSIPSSRRSKTIGLASIASTCRKGWLPR